MGGVELKESDFGFVLSQISLNCSNVKIFFIMRVILVLMVSL